MKKWQKISFISSGVLLMMGTLFAGSFAWFQDLNAAGLNNGQGYTASAYFAGGGGSEADPYLIDRPIHMYNLAWLQYLGYFNQTNSSNAYQQTYFKLNANVDMTSDSENNWTLPPIGTSSHPFIGNFDGGGFTISNLAVDNVLGEGHITRKPSTVSTLTDVNIVGTFGVVGDFNSVLGTTYTYSSAVNTVKNVYLDNATVTTSASTTLIGVAAGYVNAAITGVGVSNGHVAIASNCNILDSSLTSHFSDYTTIGYATANFKGNRNVTSVNAYNPTSSTGTYTAQQQGTLSGWGGSIDMKSMYDRLVSIRGQSSSFSPYQTETDDVYIDGTTRVVSGTTYDATFKQYYDATNPLKGKFCYCLYQTGDSSTVTYLYLYGKKDFSDTITTRTYTEAVTFAISYQNTYMIPSGTTSITTTATSTNAFVWHLTNPSGAGNIWASVNNTPYYLAADAPSSTYGDGPCYLTSSPQVQWTRTGNYFSCVLGSTTYYLEFYNNAFQIYRSKYTETVLSTSTANYTSSTASGYSSTYDTYFPLNVDSSYLPTTTNTGYVISGSTYTSSDYAGSSGSGDIRVSQYGMKNLYQSLNGTSSSATYSKSKLEILTRTSNSGSFVRIDDDDISGGNHSNTSVSTSMAAYITKTSYKTLGFSKYAKSRASLDTLFSGSTNIYGLHFMNASISINDLATVASARINKAGSDVTDYLNYPMPRNSIDFNLRKKGYINFFAGTYFPNNNSFFSLHKITRNAAQTITDIKEIKYIYQSSLKTDPYIYQYSDNTYSATLSANYSTTPVFDTSWIKNPTMLMYACYYFEIPVNEGEYALGSVSGGTGSYLFYLDISANAQLIDRTTITDYVVLVTNVFDYPLGIAVVALPATGGTPETVNALNSADASINSGYTGTLAFAKSASVVTYTSSSDNFSPGFKGDSITLARGGGGTLPAQVPKSTSTDTIKRITYVDYNTATDETTRTIITDTNGTVTYSFIANDGTVSVPTEYYDNDGNLITTLPTTFAINVSNNTTPILTYWYSFNAAKSTITLSFNFTYTQSDVTQGDGTTLKKANVTGYTLTLASNTDDLTVYITTKGSDYIINFVTNGTTTSVSVGSTITVTHG